LRLSDDLSLLGQGRWYALPTQAPFHTWLIDGAVRYQYATDFAIGVEASHQPAGHSVQATSYLYF
jgi:hypothetical protein